MTIENRWSARYPAALPIEALGLPISCHNVSATGMQLSCPSINYRLLHERFEEGDLELTIELPDGVRVAGRARRVYASAYDDEYLIGVQLSGLSDAHQHSYLAYLRQLESKFA